MIRSIRLALLCGILSTAAQAQPAPQPPSVLFGDLYRSVEMAQIFPDQKTFADAIPLQPQAQIMQAYRQQIGKPGFDLHRFVATYFRLPQRPSVRYTSRPAEDVRDYISGMWPLLTRQPNDAEPGSSLLPLPYPYVVPGGRFSEIYYWDTFFTMLGLEQDRRDDLAQDMLDNIAALITRYGHMPNGNRSYYLSRSQPPFFACMIDLIAAHQGPKTYLAELPVLQREYDYWMQGVDTLPPNAAHRHVVRLADGTVLNRYWDDRADPRDESYREDVQTAAHASRPAAEIYRDLRAGAETGWDFSSRWLADGQTLATIRTTDLLPVDLNSLIAHMERILAKAYNLKGDSTRSMLYRQRAAQREAAIRRLMWDTKQGVFSDYLWRSGERTHIVTAATVYPLYFHIATTAQAQAIAQTIRAKMLEPGGLATTLRQSNQQWDQPNGWAPLQYLAVEGLNAYGEKSLANEIAQRWVHNNLSAYKTMGVLLEKYDLRATDRPGGGGEYPSQVGFGWTNGVLLSLMRP